jgi:hypothetical protein
VTSDGMYRISTPSRWLMLAGTPRGGTTFVGRILSVPLSVDFIHEPFNPACGIEGLSQPYVYTKPGLTNEPTIAAAVRELLDYRARLRIGRYRNDGVLRRLGKPIVGSRGPFHYRLARYNPWHRVALVKDPIGCLLTEYLVRSFSFSALILVRHPIAVAEDFGRLRRDANAGLASLRSQPAFVADYLTDDDKRLINREYSDHRVAAAVLWRILCRALTQQASVIGTPIVRLEDIAARPVEEFRRLYERYDLPWSTMAERRIVRVTSGRIPTPRAIGQAREFSRDAATVTAATIERMPRASRGQVLDLCGEVAERWYDRSSFEF